MSWAKKIEESGLPNFHKVSDTLYRAAQPTAEGMQRLEDLGVKTIVNLRSFHSDRKAIGDKKLDYLHLTMKAWHPEDKEVVRFLEVVLDDARTPTLVHCMHGADRTGLMCAIYRVAVDAWTKDDALTEMLDGGFGYHSVWVNLPKYFKKLDIEKLKTTALANIAARK